MQGFPTLGMPQPTGSPVDWSWAATAPSLGQPPSGEGPGTYPAADVPALPWPTANPSGAHPLPSAFPGTPHTPLPVGGAPPVLATPGPAALGPGSAQGSLGTGGVAGVSIPPVTTVLPPAATGGPHPLPPMPPCPLPQGFPNPFDLQSLTRGGGAMGAGPGPLEPGTITVTGPQGYLPGLGYFGSPGLPGGRLPGPQGGLLTPPGSLPGQLTAPVQQPHALPPRPTRGQAAPTPSPFWPALAWQLVNIPAVRSALGGRLAGLMEGDGRLRTIQVATALLLSPEMQNAFRAVSTGAAQQAPFALLFADRFRGALDAAGLGVAG